MGCVCVSEAKSPRWDVQHARDGREITAKLSQWESAGRAGSSGLWINGGEGESREREPHPRAGFICLSTGNPLTVDKRHWLNWNRIIFADCRLQHIRRFPDSSTAESASEIHQHAHRMPLTESCCLKFSSNSAIYPKFSEIIRILVAYSEYTTNGRTNWSCSLAFCVNASWFCDRIQKHLFPHYDRFRLMLTYFPTKNYNAVRFVLFLHQNSGNVVREPIFNI